MDFTGEHFGSSRSHLLKRENRIIGRCDESGVNWVYKIIQLQTNKGRKRCLPNTMLVTKIDG